jgi:hypothetical protein
MKMEEGRRPGETKERGKELQRFGRAAKYEWLGGAHYKERE